MFTIAATIVIILSVYIFYMMWRLADKAAKEKIELNNALKIENILSEDIQERLEAIEEIGKLDHSPELWIILNLQLRIENTATIRQLIKSILKHY